MKHHKREIVGQVLIPAAFGRLCVETKIAIRFKTAPIWPAAFGRLCVETAIVKAEAVARVASRLRAAVC